MSDVHVSTAPVPENIETIIERNLESSMVTLTSGEVVDNSTTDGNNMQQPISVQFSNGESQDVFIQSPSGISDSIEAGTYSEKPAKIELKDLLEAIEQLSVQNPCPVDESNNNDASTEDDNGNLKADSSSKKHPSFVDELCKFPVFSTRHDKCEYHSYPILKRTTRQLSQDAAGLVLQSTDKQPPKKVIHVLEEYVKNQTATLLDNMDQRSQKESPSMAAANFPLMIQGMDTSWPEQSHRPEIEVIYSVDKSLLTVDLDLDNYSENEGADWKDEDGPHHHHYHAKTKAELIAEFVHRSIEQVPEAGLEVHKGHNELGTVIQPAGPETDDIILAFLETVQEVNQLLMDSIIINREALDILTFPLSHDFEPFGRIKGIFWTLAQSARIIRCKDNQVDADSMIDYITKEIKIFRPLVEQFMRECLTLLNEIGDGLKQVQKVLNELAKVSRKLFSFPAFKRSSSLSIYSTALDPTTITFYEQFQGTAFLDYNKTSIELLWTPTLSYFKGFKETDWYCLQVEVPHLQVKTLLALIKLSRKIFVDVKYILEEENETFASHLTIAVQSIHKKLKLMKNSTAINKASASVIPRVQHQIQILFDLYNTLQNFQEEFENGFKWINSVVYSVSQMAGLRPEDVDDLREKRDRSSSKCSIFSKCKQKVHPFLQSNFQFMLLRVPLQNDVMFRLIQGLRDKDPWNLHAQQVLTVMNEAQITQFRERQKEDDSPTGLHKDADVEEEVETNVAKTPMTVYNVGHVHVKLKTDN